MRAWVLIWMCALSAALVACGGGGGSSGSNPNQPNLTVSTGESVVLPVGAFKTYSVYGGVPPYQAVSNEAAIAVANIKGSELTIGGVAGGKTTVRVFDNRGALYLTEVTVGSSIPLYTSAPSSVTLLPPGSAGCSGSTTSGGSAIYSIAGGAPPYSVVSSDPSVVSVQMIDATRWRATATGIGSATVEVRDAGGSAPVAVGVTVDRGSRPSLSISPEKLLMPAGFEAEVTVSGGVGPYRVSGGIPAAIQVTPSCSDDGKFKIRGTLASKLDVGFVDTTGASVKVEVEVNTASANFRLSPSPVNVSENSNEPLTFSLFGFYGDTATGVSSGRVCVFISDSTLFALESSLPQCATYSATNRSFTLVTGSKGNRCVSANTPVEIRAVDALGQVATGTVNVVDNGPSCGSSAGFALIPNNVSVSPNTETEVAIRGGSGAFAATSSNPSVVTATVDSTKGTLTLKGGASRGTAVVILTDIASGAQARVDVSNGTTGLGALSVSPASLAVSPTLTNRAVIGGGSGSYAVTSSDPLVATGAVQGQVLMVTGGSRVGTARLTVIDTNNPSAASAVLEVSNTIAGALSVSPDRLAVSPTLTNRTVIGGGSGSYAVTSSDPLVATGAVQGQVLTVTGGNRLGSATLTITDVNNPSAAPVTVSVNNSNTVSGLAAVPNAVTVGNNSSTTVLIRGGSGQYVATTLDSRIALAAADGNVVTITGGTAGTVRVQVTDVLTGNSVDITVTTQ